jgi:hypothetical protein
MNFVKPEEKRRPKSVTSLRHIILLICLCLPLASAFAQNALSLDAAIEEAAFELNEILPAGAEAAIIHMDSPSPDLSAYLLEEVTKYLLNEQKIVLVERSDMDLAFIEQEIEFQTSGEVSEESAVSIGQKLGAEIIISGTITVLDRSSRFLLKAVDVKTARVLSLITKLVNANDRTLGQLAPGTGPSPEDWKHKRLYIGAQGSFSSGFYEDSGGLMDPTVYSNLSMNGIPSFEGGLSFGVSILDFLEARTGASIQVDGSELFSGNRSLMKVSASSLLFPLTVDLVYRPSIFMIRGYAGVGFSLPLGQMKVTHSNGSWTADYTIPPSFIGGAAGGVKLGPGVIFADVRFLTDFANTSANHNGIKDIYHRSKVSASLGYEIGLLRKK